MKNGISLFLFLSVSITCVTCWGSAFGSKPGPIRNNTLPIWNGEPRFLKKTTNGIMYEIGDPAYNNTMKLIHVYGTIEEMGAA